MTSSTEGMARSAEENAEFVGVGRFSFRSSAPVSVSTPESTDSAPDVDLA